MKSIFAYTNYRTLLRDGYQAEKTRVRTFTYATFAKKARLGSPNYLKLVIDGRRNLTTTNIHVFAKLFRFAGPELDFFEALVLENQAKGLSEKRYYARRLTALRKSEGASTTTKRLSPTSLLESSLRIAVLLLAKGKNEKEALEILASELGLGSTQAKGILEQLCKAAELTLDANDVYVFADRHRMMNDPAGISERLKKFLEQGLEESREVFSKRYQSGSAKFLSLLMTAPAGSLLPMFEDLKAAVESVSHKYDPLPDQEKCVYRVQFQTYRFKRSEE